MGPGNVCLICLKRPLKVHMLHYPCGAPRKGWFMSMVEYGFHGTYMLLLVVPMHGQLYGLKMWCTPCCHSMFTWQTSRGTTYIAHACGITRMVSNVMHGGC